MKEIATLIKRGFASACYMTPEFKSFATKFKNRVKKALTEIGCRDIEFSVNHFEVSFFFTSDNGQAWYGHLNDVRWFGDIYIRRAKDYKDYRGDSNIHISDIANFKNEVATNIRRYRNHDIFGTPRFTAPTTPKTNPVDDWFREAFTKSA